MSYFLLARGDGTTEEVYSVSNTFTYLYGIYSGVSAEFTFVNDIYAAIQAQFTYIWKIYSYVSKEFTFKWDIGYYIQREFTYLWNLYATAASIGGKVRYSFRTSAVVNRFYRKFRHG